MLKSIRIPLPRPPDSAAAGLAEHGTDLRHEGPLNQVPGAVVSLMDRTNVETVIVAGKIRK